MRTRISAEDQGFAQAELVFVNSQHEKLEQCSLYDSFQNGKCRVLPPGVDFNCHLGIDRTQLDSSRHDPVLIGTRACGELVQQISMFLKDPQKPPVVMVARPTVSKNAIALVRAFGQSARLREKANLVLLMGVHLVSVVAILSWHHRLQGGLGACHR